jgi:deoxycytidine triphosphate deaminase
MLESKGSFASSDDEAFEKFKKCKKVDPYPDIRPSLLNSADIHRYIRKTGMVYPYDRGNLKSASYAAKIAGECKYWDEKEEKFKTISLEKDRDKLILKPNSIAFVGIEPTFRLPDYIAIRFNLKITHVYRGLLLGTGPLVDPGFEGKINIPLHNLTSNEYIFHFGEELIWIEFTKTSKLPNNYDDYVEFPENKKHKKLDYYLAKALENNSSEQIASSIPAAIKEAKESADEAEKAAKGAGKTAKGIAFGSLIAGAALLLSVGTLIYESWNLQRQYIDHSYDMIVGPLIQYKKDMDFMKFEQGEMVDTLEQKLISKINNQNKKIIELEKKIKQIESVKK